MLEGLCGNKNVQKILFFLFVNGKCYGTQRHRQLNTPLTPLQKALSRLEKGGLITSYTVGKTKLYQFDPAYPLMNELEQLIKKAYTLLSAEEKKDYYAVNDAYTTTTNQAQNLQTLLTFWERLTKVKELHLSAKAKKGWTGSAKGEVTLTKSPNQLVFTEKGAWQGAQAAQMNFSNCYRWTLDRDAGVISLEHLRQGPDHPVFLLHLSPTSKSSLSSVDSHLCGGDAYFGQLHFDRNGLRLNWRVIGPDTNDAINYYYY